MPRCRRHPMVRLGRAGGVALALAAVGVLAVFGGCEQTGQESRQTQKEDAPMSFELSSTAFDHNAIIPKEHTGEGRDVSPPLEWVDAPPETRAFALICDDPDAPAGTWTHWVIWNIPADRTGLSEGIPQKTTLPDLGGARQGVNSWQEDNIGYRGPMPPPGHGTHHYHFTLYALNKPLDLKAGASKRELQNAMAGHILGETRLTGTYER